MTTIRSHQARGKEWEKEVARYLGGLRARVSNPDTGDVAGIPGVVVECKAQGRLEPFQWIAQVQRQREEANAVLGLVAIKKRGSSKAEQGLWLIDPRCVPGIVAMIEEGEL